MWSIPHLLESSLTLQIGINNVHPSCCFSPSYRQSVLKASHALLPLSVTRNKKQSRWEILYVCGGGLSVFSQNIDNYWASGKEKERQRKNVYLKASSFTTQWGPAQRFQVKALFGSEFLHAQERMGARLFFFWSTGWQLMFGGGGC